MTKEVINKMPDAIKLHLESLRKDYKNEGLNKNAVRKEAFGYTLGLRDAGLISERERMILFVYATV